MEVALSMHILSMSDVVEEVLTCPKPVPGTKAVQKTLRFIS